MQTDIKILLRLHHSLVFFFPCSFYVCRQRVNLSLPLRVSICSVCFRAWITVQFKSQGRPVDGHMWARESEREKEKQVPLHPQSDTYLSLLQRSLIQRPDWSDYPAVPFFKFAIQPINIMKGTNQRWEEAADIVEEVRMGHGYSRAK